MLALSLISALAVASTAYAHGNIDEVVVDGTAYTGYLPYQCVLRIQCLTSSINKVP